MGMTEKVKTLSYEEMTLQAVLNIKVFRKGASRQAIRKYIETTFKIEPKWGLRRAIKKLVTDGLLIQEGQRFKLDPEKKAAMKKGPPKKKKPDKKKPAKKKPKKKTAKKKTAKKKKPAKKKP